jgi:myo-inositol-1(or 4)-monophosphatase
MPGKTLAKRITPLQGALEAAVAAGAVLRRKFPHAREVKSKGWRDIVTDADFAAQNAALSVLRARFPRHAVLSEEGRHDIDLKTHAPAWVIDPLDGTTNYSRRFPSFSVAIALVRGGELLLGVVHDPLRRDTFFAQKGRGAFLQSGRGRPRPVRVSGLANFGEALVGVDWARDPALRRRVAEAVGRASAECRTVRAIGSAALGLAYVAAGWLDGYFHLALQPWDVAAGALLVAEAGGRLSAPGGGAWHLGQAQLVASNRALHGMLLRALALG